MYQSSIKKLVAVAVVEVYIYTTLNNFLIQFCMVHQSQYTYEYTYMCTCMHEIVLKT